MLTGTLISVIVQTGNQINLSVLYEDSTTGFSRTNIFTVLAEEAKRLSDPIELQNLIVSQGKQYADTQVYKPEFDKLIGQAFDIAPTSIPVAAVK